MPTTDLSGSEDLSLQYDIASTLARSRDVREALARVLETLVMVQRWDIGIAWLTEGDHLRYLTEFIAPDARARLPQLQMLLEPARYRLRACHAGRGAAEPQGSMYACECVQSGAPVCEWGARATAVGLTSAIAIPLESGSTLYGVIELFAHESHTLRAARSCLRSIAQDIAGFLRARRPELRVKSRHARLEEAQRIARLAYWEYHPSSGKLRSAGEMSEVLGVRRCELPGTLAEYTQCLPEEERPGFLAALKRAQDPLVRSAEFEHRFQRTRNGSQRVMLLRALSDFDASGQLFRISGTVQDVSSHRQLEDSLHLAATAINHAGDAIVIFDARGSILSTNPAFTRITGYAESEASGHQLDVLLVRPGGRHDESFYRRLLGRLRTFGRWKGELWAQAKNGRKFAMLLSLNEIRDPMGRVTHHVGVFADVSRQHEYKERLEQLALHDSLTGLPNRALFFDRGAQALAQAERSGTLVGLIFIDLDLFKAVNDQYGHAVGDEVLRQAGERMHDAMRVCDTVARLGGDEFVVLLTGISGQRDCTVAAERLVQCLCQPYSVNGVAVEVGASLGLALSPMHGIDIHTLLHRADQALYSIKRNDRQRYAIWLPDLVI